MTRERRLFLGATPIRPAIVGVMLYRAMVIGLALCCSTGTLFAQRTDYEIRGRVIIPEGRPNEQEGIEVQLQRPGRLIAGTAFTDRDGKFFFHNIDRPDIYYIYIRLEGYDEVRQKVEVSGKY